jgi:hypothetical protein
MGVFLFMESFQCPLCLDSYDKLISLSLHWRGLHKKKSCELYLSLNGLKEEPTCKCGCGETVKFLSISEGYREYKVGHISRVVNNYRTENSVNNSLKTRREMVRAGSWLPFRLKSTGKSWSYGLTKETDERVARISNILKTQHQAMLSERLRKGRLEGTVPTQRGEKHSQWKGGVSLLNSYCRNNRKLYTEWKMPKLINAGYKCEKCGLSEGGLHVHHDKETFSDILRKIAKSSGWDGNLSSKPNKPLEDTKNKIAELVAEYHIRENVSGIVLCFRCHEIEHGYLNLRSRNKK